MADRSPYYKRLSPYTPTALHDARNVRKARDNIGSSMLTYKNNGRSRSPLLAEPNPGSYLEQSIKKRTRELEKMKSGKETPRTPDRYSNRELSPAETLRVNPYSPSQHFTYTPKQNQGQNLSFFDNENNLSKSIGRKDRSILDTDLSIIENEYRKKDASMQKLLDQSKEEEKFLMVLKSTLEQEARSPKKIESSPGSTRFEDFMSKLKRDKQDFYKKLEQQSRKLSPEVIRNNPYIPQDTKYLDQSIEDLITKRVGSMRMNFKHFQDEFDRMVKRQKDFWQNNNARRSEVENLVGGIRRSPLRQPSPEIKASVSSKNLPENSKSERSSPSPSPQTARDESSKALKTNKNLVASKATTKSKESAVNSKKNMKEGSNKSSQEGFKPVGVAFLEAENVKLKNDVEYLKKRLQDKDLEILKVRKTLHEAQENVLKIRVDKEKENVELLEALEHNRKQREKIENELDKALRKLVKLQKTFNDNAESFAQMKRHYEQFKSELKGNEDLPGKLKQLEAQLAFQEDTNSRLIKNLDEILVKSENETTEIEYGYMLRLNEKSNELEMAKLQKEKAEIELNTALKKMTENELFYQNQIDMLKEMISHLENSEDQTRDNQYNIELELKMQKEKANHFAELSERLQKELEDIEKVHDERIQKLNYAYEFDTQNKATEIANLQKKLFQAEEAIRRSQEDTSVEHEKLKSMFNDLYKEYEDYRSVQGENFDKYKQEQNEEKVKLVSLKTSQQETSRVQELEAVYKQQMQDQAEQIKRLNERIKEIERIEKQKSEENLARIMDQYEAFKAEQTRTMDKILFESENKISHLELELRARIAECERLSNIQSDKDSQIQGLREELEKAFNLLKSTKEANLNTISEKDVKIQKLKEELDKALNSTRNAEELNSSVTLRKIEDLESEVESLKVQQAKSLIDYNSEKEKISAEKAALTLENQKLAAEIQEKLKNIQNLEQELKKAQNSFSELKDIANSAPSTDDREIQGLKEQVSKLKDELTSVTSDFEKEKQAFDASNQMNLLKLEALQKENSVIKTSYEEALQKKEKDFAELNQKYNTSQEDYKRLTTQLSSSSDATNSQAALLQSELKRLQAQNEELKTKSASDLDEVKAKSTAELNDQKTKFEAEIKALQTQNEDLKTKSVADLNELKAKNDQEISKIKSDLAQAEQSIAQLKLENQSLNQNSGSQAQELSAKLSLVEATLQTEKAEASKKYDALKQEYAKYKDEHEKQLSQQSSSQSNQASELASLQTKISELTQAASAKDQQIQKLQNDLNTATAEASKSSASLKDFEAQIANIKASLASATQEKDALSNSLNLEKQKSDDLQKKVQACEAEKADLLKNLDQAAKSATQMATDYEAKIQQIQASQGQSAQSQVAAANQELTKAKEQVSQLTDENKKLKNTNQELNNTKAMLEMNTTQLKGILDEQDKQVKDLETKLASAGKAEIAAKDNEIAQLKKQVDDIKKEMTKISEGEAQAVQELIAAKAQIADLQAKAAGGGGGNTAALDKRIKDLEQELKDNQELMEYYKGEVGKSFDQIAQYEAKEQGYLKQIRELKKK